MPSVNYALASLGAVITQEGGVVNGGHNLSLAIDGSDQTYFRGQPYFGSVVIRVDLGAPQFITSVDWLGDPVLAPGGCTLYGSLNGTVWDNLYTFAQQAGLQTANFPDGVTYRYFRLACFADNYHLYVYSWNVWGPVVAPPPPENPATGYINAWLDGLEENYVPDVQAWLDAH